LSTNRQRLEAANAINATMERMARIHIAKLPEGMDLPTSDDVPGLVAQGRTVAETLETPRDVARKLIEFQGTAGPRAGVAETGAGITK
jgi:predicted RNase H-like HicB family nuclease